VPAPKTPRSGPVPAINETYRCVRLRDLAVNERPQERLEKHGPASLSDSELMAMLLRCGSRDLDVMSVASRIISEAGSISELIKWTESDFMQLKGIGKVKALQLITVMEIARRVLVQKNGFQPLLNSPELVFQYLRPLAAGLEVEKFWVLCLNRKNRLIKRCEVTSGTASSSLVHPREVFREAIRSGALSLIGAHNHPSGDPSPSSADIQVTRQLREAGKTVSIELLDHIIIGDEHHDPHQKGFYSFKEAGLL
jgi:DNA repair protein RadC